MHSRNVLIHHVKKKINDLPVRSKRLTREAGKHMGQKGYKATWLSMVCMYRAFDGCHFVAPHER
ncbi:hypothetical protein [Desulfosediminicola sp.]|uniref:hypothetical protein n=1 Tax=Desulfosediminicola sp. TaxID=2886825 RepID=UPI003AF2A530